MASDFSIWLKEARARRGLSQKALSEAAGLSDGLVGFLETGDRPPTRESITALAKALVQDSSDQKAVQALESEALFVAGIERVISSDELREAGWNDLSPAQREAHLSLIRTSPKPHEIEEPRSGLRPRTPSHSGYDPHLENTDGGEQE